MKSKPLMPRGKISKELAGINYGEYLIKQGQNLLEISIQPKIVELDIKIHFLMATVEQMSEKQKDIEELWNFPFEEIYSMQSEISHMIQSIYYNLVSITGEANFLKSDLERIYYPFYDFCKIKIRSNIYKGNNFALEIENFNEWYHINIQFLKYLELSICEQEMIFLKGIVDMNKTKFEILKSTSSSIYIRFNEIIKLVYKKVPKANGINYRDFYLLKCQEQIIIAKNSGNYLGFNILLEDYYSEKFNNHRFINWCFKYLIGYGENPSGLIILFLLINIIFSLLFISGSFHFHFSEKEPVEFCEKFITFFFFNNTTMLTVGYGDIFPVSAGAKIIVMILQIIGFTISGSAIALLLKRILRF